MPIKERPTLVVLKIIKNLIIANQIHSIVDISDLGNEIGVALPPLSESEIDDFILGFKHGASIRNNLHCIKSQDVE